MKLSIPFMRKKPQRKPLRTEFVQSWTTRDWADLPTHHPRRD